MGSQWTHVLCQKCWYERNTTSPVKVQGITEPERCCDCGADTTAGIYVRHDPASMPCGGTGPAHEDKR